MQLSPNPDAALAVATIFSLDEITSTVVDYSGAIVFDHRTELKTQDLTRSEIPRAIITSLHKTLKKAAISADQLSHIELSFQGATDVTNGILMWSPILRHKGIALKDKLEDEFNVSVCIRNDCNMIVRALSEQNHAELGSTFSAVLFSHGIGMGVLHENRLISGARSSATEFGHMLHQANGALCRCGKSGCIEAYAADYAIWRRAKQLEPAQDPQQAPDFDALQELIVCARNRAGPERQAFIDAGHAIGTGLGNLFALLDSFPVALVGPMTEAFDLMEPSIREGIQHGIREEETDTVPIICFTDDRALIREGCIQSALDAIDLNCFVTETHEHE